MSNLSNSQINVIPHEHTSSDITDLNTLLAGKQDTLIAGDNIQVAADGKTISAVDTKYSAGANVSIDENNQISAVDTKYSAGTNVSIDANNNISAVDTKYSKATSSTLGLIKLVDNTVQSVAANAASSAADRTYPVQLNENDQAVVNVPWSDTTVGSATSSVAGTVKLASDTVQTVAAQSVSATANRTYGVQKNSNGQMVVNVPWENTQTTVVDDLTSTSATNALSANQGRILKGLVDEAKAKAKFLSLWNAETGMPISFPLGTPYAYSTGDYFMVEVVPSSGNIYMPNGVSYTGAASTTIDSENDVQVGDFYIYDGAVWLYASNHGKEVSFANITGQPSDNTNLATALGAKANTSDVLTKTNTTSYTPSANYHPATKKYVDDTASSAASGKVSDTAYASSWDGETTTAPSKNAVYDKISSMDTAIGGKQDKATSGSTAPSTTPSYVGEQYVDTTNDKLYVATGTASSSDWMEVGAGGGFTPENTGTEGQVLTKTNTGYQWEDAQGGTELPYLCFTANLAGSTVNLHKQGSPTAVTLETSTDGNTWSNYTFDTDITLSNAGDKVYFRNTSTTDTGFSTDNSNYYRFIMTGSVSASGDTNYLLNKNSTTTVSGYCYHDLFLSCQSLTTAPELPATTLADYCYSNTFANCRKLTIAPRLPATTMANHCYYYLFSQCHSLITAPELPATTLAQYCYQYMFYNCYNLIIAPELPATTLAQGCYEFMFRYCISLTTPPKLPAKTLSEYCYQEMFENCLSLIAIPDLPATTLKENCYFQMFYGCHNLKLSTTQTGVYQTAYRIPYTGTGTTATNALYNMFALTSGTFTGTPNINTNYYTYNRLV